MNTYPVALTLSLAAIPLVGCHHLRSEVTPFPHGEAVPLLEGPVHLGDEQAGGQNFPAGGAVAARVCALINMPQASDVYVQALGVRNTETLSNMLMVNGRGYPLPVTLERDAANRTSNSMSASPVERLRLEQGPSEFCLVAGQKPNGDIDDFEVAALTVFVEGIDARDIGVRRGLTLGAPGPSSPPSVPWGQRQQWPAASDTDGRWGGYGARQVP